MITEFLNKGTYGCIFHPSINACNGAMQNEEDGEHYITKIQRENSDSSEIQIGNKIKKIKNYEQFFAPIISSCEVIPNRINYNLIKTCNSVQNDFSEIDNTRKYTSSKIRYVGKDPIDKYISTIKTPIAKLINMHLYLLDAINLLQHKNIIHFDIKPDNILFDEIQSIPIIIDFGLSNTTNIFEKSISPKDNVEKLKDIFISYDTYDFWCIDIFIISKILYEKQFYMEDEVSLIQVEIILHTFKTSTLYKCFTDTELKEFDHYYRNHFTKKYIENNKTWIDVFNDLIKNYNTWDNYSLALTFLYIYAKHHHKMTTLNTEYIKLLKDTVLALPDNRITYDATKTRILEIIS